MIVVSVCLPSEALSQHLPSYLGFTYLGRGLSLPSCSSEVKLLLLTLVVGCVLKPTAPDFGRVVSPLCCLLLLHCPPAASCSCIAVATPSLSMRYLLSAAGHSCTAQPQLIGLEIMVHVERVDTYCYYV